MVVTLTVDCAFWHLPAWPHTKKKQGLTEPEVEVVVEAGAEPTELKEGQQCRSFFHGKKETDFQGALTAVLTASMSAVSTLWLNAQACNWGLTLHSSGLKLHAAIDATGIYIC